MGSAPALVAVLWVVLVFVVVAVARLLSHSQSAEDAKTDSSGLPVLHVLVIPGGPLPTASSPPSAPLTAGPPPSAPPPTTHVVEPGETLGSIAERYGTTIQALITLNDLSDAGLIRSGQVLRLLPEATPTPP